MKKILLSALMAFIGSTSLFAQSNVFPTSGNVGIGTSNPKSILDIEGTVYIGGEKANLDPMVSNINFDLLKNSKKTIIGWNYSGGKGETSFISNRGGGTTDGGFSFYDLGLDGKIINLFNIHGNGNVGIGTDKPDEKLTVKGKIHAEEIIVDLAVPADYVFQKYFTGKSELKADYEFPKLEEVEKFVKENNHLPGIPSAKEIQEKGLKVGEMNNLLLQKIEELTLLLIEQNKKMAQQEERINELETKK
ncbi:hypothetical protein [Empedobacter brevis]